MKEKGKLIGKLILVLIGVALVIAQIISMINFLGKNEKVEATSKSGNTSDVQLLARAINRRSKRRTL